MPEKLAVEPDHPLVLVPFYKDGETGCRAIEVRYSLPAHALVEQSAAKGVAKTQPVISSCFS